MGSYRVWCYGCGKEINKSGLCDRCFKEMQRDYRHRTSLPCGQQSAEAFGFGSVSLHVFFIHLEETPEMLARIEIDEEFQKQRAAEARSKIFKDDSLIPFPIDKTAFLVAGEPEEFVTGRSGD